MINLLCAMALASVVVLGIHCNIWYYSLPKEERKRMDEEIDL